MSFRLLSCACSENQAVVCACVSTVRADLGQTRFQIEAKYGKQVGTLWAGNIEIGRLDPDSPTIGQALRRLEQSTRYPWELVGELKELQRIARTLFNQSEYAYPPSDADAREYILRCEKKRRQLHQSDQL